MSMWVKLSTSRTIAWLKQGKRKMEFSDKQNHILSVNKTVYAWHISVHALWLRTRWAVLEIQDTKISHWPYFVHTI